MLLNLQPIPYQGSKRKAASRILKFAPSKIDVLYEPFAGSMAITLFAAHHNLANRYVINDSCEPLANLLRFIVERPEECAKEYATLWEQQMTNPVDYYYRIREEFNTDRNPAKFLFLMSKCAKNAVRFNSSGKFNQSPDKRRLGRAPATMREHLLHTSLLLKGKSTFYAKDYADIIKEAGPKDLVYMDPPYQGTSTNKNPRYHQGIDLNRLISELGELDKKRVPVLLSFDGRLGDKSYGDELPKHLNLHRFDIHMGRSAQATLNGKSLESIESLYVSKKLLRK